MNRPPSRVLLLFHKDFLRRVRSPLGVLTMIAFPLVFSGMMALALGGEEALPRARLLFEDRDGGMVSGMVKSFLTSDRASAFLELVEVGEEGRQIVEDNEASALLRIPEGTTDKLLGGEAVTLELIRNPAQTILPEIAEQFAAILADVMSIVAGTLDRQTEDLELMPIESFGDSTDDEYARLPADMRRLIREGERYVTEPPITFAVATVGDQAEEEEGGGASAPTLILLLVLPGISVYSLFVIGNQMMHDVLTEARLGTLRRQLCAPVTGGQIITAKVLLTAVVATIVLLILATFAGILAPDPVDFAGFAVLSLALVLAVTGFAAMIYGAARTESQGGTIAAVVYLAMAFSGGSFVSLDRMPAAVRSISPASPFYWGTRGFQDLLGGGGLADVLVPVAVLGGLGLTLLVAGAFLLQRKVLRGEAG